MDVARALLSGGGFACRPATVVTVLVLEAKSPDIGYVIAGHMYERVSVERLYGYVLKTEYEEGSR